MHHSAHVDVKGLPAGVHSLFQSVGPRSEQAGRLSAKPVYLLSHLTGTTPIIFLMKLTEMG